MKTVTVTHSCNTCGAFVKSEQEVLAQPHSVVTIVAGAPVYCVSCTTVEVPEINVWKCVPELAADILLEIDGKGGYLIQHRICDHKGENNCE